MPTKTTQPWDKQYGLWTLLSLFGPQFARGFKSAKPNMFDQVFGKRNGPNDVAGMFPSNLNMLGNYDPFGFLAQNPFGRPQTQAEQDLMNRSLFGMAAPFNLGPMQQIADQGNGLRAGLVPGAGNLWDQQLNQAFAGLGGPMTFNSLSMPSTPRMPSMPSIPSMNGIGGGGFGMGAGVGGLGGLGGLPSPPTPSPLDAPEMLPPPSRPSMPAAPSLPGGSVPPNSFLPPWLS